MMRANNNDTGRPGEELCTFISAVTVVTIPIEATALTRDISLLR